VVGGKQANLNIHESSKTMNSKMSVKAGYPGYPAKSLVASRFLKEKGDSSL